MIQLRSVRRRSVEVERPELFPFGIAAIRTLTTLELAADVTFFAGENGSGKSTLLEAIALAAGLPAIGSHEISADASLSQQRRLARSLTLSWARRKHRGFFLRAEDFFGFTKRLARERDELLLRLTEVDEEYERLDRSSLARALARGPALASLGAMAEMYGSDPDAASHGQQFLGLFRSRFVPGGLYLLDEPEAALSAQSQLALIAMMHEMVGDESQFIVATHSPILLAYPGAKIVSFDRSPLCETRYEDLEQVRLTREFLAQPERFLRHIAPLTTD